MNRTYPLSTLNTLASTSSESKLIQACLSEFTIPASLSTLLDRYYILHWTGMHLARIQKHGTITREGIEYHVIYQDHILPYQLQGISQVRVSFRKPRNFSYGYALVRKVGESK